MALRIAVGLVSAAILGYEILLLRFFSITYWHHFAFMIISLALLGFGASGTVIALARKWLSQRLTPAFVATATLFGISALGALVVTKSVPYNPLELVWDVRQPVYLTLHYLVLAVPFLCGGFAIGLALSCNRAELHRIYRYDLIGAGAGAVAVMLALSTLPLEYCFKLTGLAGFAAAGVAAVGLARLRVVAFAAIAALAAAATAIPGAWLQPTPSPYKDLSAALRLKGASVLTTRSGPLGVVTAVASPDVPFRHAPDLSLNAPQVPTEQIALFTDGDGLSPITRFENDFEELRYLDFMPMSLPYHLVRQPRVLVLGAGGGSDVLLARYHGARSIDAVELSPEIVELVRGPFAGYAGHLFDAPNTTIHVAEARHFAATTDQRFELIQISMLDSFNAASAGVHALNESGLYTVEALSIFYGRLAPTGMLAITRWLKLPPRDGLRLFATALEVLRRQNIADPARRLALVRSWNTVTLLMARAPIDAEQIASVRRFAEQRGYDIAYLPGMVSADANRFNLLPEPYFFAGARALLGDSRRRFLDAYKFDVRPITDDRPYFFHFFKWRLLPELIASPGRAGIPLIEMGYVVLFATLVQAALVAAILILLPLALGGAIGWPHPPPKRYGCWSISPRLAWHFCSSRSRSFNASVCFWATLFTPSRWSSRQCWCLPVSAADLPIVSSVRSAAIRPRSLRRRPSL